MAARAASTRYHRPRGLIDWLRQSDEVQKLIAESFKGVDTMLMGRKTYEFALRMGGPISWGQVKTYVFCARWRK